MAKLKELKISGDDSFLELPRGNTAERSNNPDKNEIRYNTDYKTIEVFNGQYWNHYGYSIPSIFSLDKLLYYVDATIYESYPKAGNTIYDLSSNELDSTMYGVTFLEDSLASYPEGEFVFDGSNDYVNCDFNNQTIQESTFEALVYDTKDNSAYRSIIQVNQSTDDALYINPTNQLMFWPCSSSALIVPSNEWVYVAATYDGVGIDYYVNNQHQRVEGVCSHMTDVQYLRMGGFGTGDGERWKGSIAMARVYERPLSMEEITRNYNYYKEMYGLT